MGKVLEINQMLDKFLTLVHVSGFYIHYNCLLSDLFQHGSTTLSSNTVKLQLLEIFGIFWYKLSIAMQSSRVILRDNPNHNRHK